MPAFARTCIFPHHLTGYFFIKSESTDIVFSVIIPAHNEADVIERCLTRLMHELDPAVDVIVVCNGCTDNTASLARAFSTVRVVEIAAASKITALNAGDRIRRFDTVAYLDADVVIDGGAMHGTVNALQDHTILVCAPQLDVDLTRASRAVRAFYNIWTRLPYFSDRRMVGSGLYVLAPEGRSRFGEFPDIIADDGYVRALFHPRERLTVPNVKFRIFAPRTLGDLIRIKTRARFGNAQLRLRYPELGAGADNRPSAFIRLVLGRPWLLPAGVLYAYTQWRTNQACRSRLSRQDFSSWERDESSRTG